MDLENSRVFYLENYERNQVNRGKEKAKRKASELKLFIF